jgi:cyclophilin family peptidyl-prolyl cis-trans isomerase
MPRSAALRRLTRQLKRLARRGQFNAHARPLVEALEPRTLMSAPTFAGNIYNQLVPTTGVLGLSFGIDGADTDGDALTITVTSDDPKLTASIQPNTTLAKLNFNKSDGTALGSIVVELFGGSAPSAVQRFINLSTNGYNPNGTINPDADPYYTNIIVHRVVPNFVIQTGDASGTGSGDSPLPDFNPNTDSDATLSFAGPGALAWANSGNNPATSNGQFFITAAPATSLDAVFNPFGQLISGWDIYDQIISSPTNTGTEKPTNPPKLASVEILNGPRQDATATIKALNGWDGQAELTITISDGVTSVVKKVQAVSSTVLGSPPKLVGVDSPQTITPGTDVTFDYAIQDTPNLGALVTAYSDVSTATVTVDNGTETISVDTPAGYIGLIQVLTQAKENNFDPRVLTQPGSQIFSIFSVNNDFPTPLNHLATGSTGAALATKFVGNRMWVANSTGGIEVYDITNPGTPTQLKTFTLLNTSAQKVQARDIEIVGNTAVVTTTSGGTYIVDIANLNSITTKSRIVFDSGDAANSAALQVQAVGNIVYVTEFTNGLSAYDVSNPASPVFLGKVKTSNGKTIEQAMDVAIVGNLAYVTDQKGFVFTVDITNPASMSILDQVSAGVAPWGITYRDEKLYVADQGLITTSNGVSTVTLAGRLLVLSTEDPDDPTLIGQRTVEGAPWQVTLMQDQAIVSTQRLPLVGGSTGGNAPVGKAVSFVNIADPSAMTILREFDASSIAGRMDVQAGTLAMPLGLAGVALFSVAQEITAIDDTATVNEDASVVINVLANDTAAQGVNKTVTQVTQPQHGTVVINEDNTVTYTPAADYYGPDAFTYRVSDGSGGVDIGTVNVTVNPVPEVTFANGVTFTDSNGVVISVKASGATVTADVADGKIAVLRVNVTGNSGSVTLTSRNGDAQIGDVVVTGTLSSFNGKTMDLLGDMTVSGSITTLTLDDVAGDSLIKFNATTGNNIKFKADQVRDLSIETLIPFAAIDVGDWQNQSATEDKITAPFITKLSSKGDLEMSLALSGLNAPTNVALNKVKAAGAIAGNWRVVGHTLNITAASTAATFKGSWAGSITSINLKTGNLNGTLATRAIGTLKVAGNLNEAKIYAGITSLGADFARGGTGVNADSYNSGLIQSITVKGQILKTTIHAGVNSAADKAIGGSISEIGSIKASFMDADSRVKAGALPRTVKIGASTVLPANDDRFDVLPAQS